MPGEPDFTGGASQGQAPMPSASSQHEPCTFMGEATQAAITGIASTAATGLIAALVYSKTRGMVWPLVGGVTAGVIVGMLTKRALASTTGREC